MKTYFRISSISQGKTAWYQLISLRGAVDRMATSDELGVGLFPTGDLAILRNAILDAPGNLVELILKALTGIENLLAKFEYPNTHSLKIISAMGFRPDIKWGSLVCVIPNEMCRGCFCTRYDRMAPAYIANPSKLGLATMHCRSRLMRKGRVSGAGSLRVAIFLLQIRRWKLHNARSVTSHSYRKLR